MFTTSTRSPKQDLHVRKNVDWVGKEYVMGLQTRHITGNENLTHYFLCTYIPQSKGSDKLSKNLFGFKKGLYPHKQA